MHNVQEVFERLVELPGRGCLVSHLESVNEGSQADAQRRQTLPLCGQFGVPLHAGQHRWSPYDSQLRRARSHPQVQEERLQGCKLHNANLLIEQLKRELVLYEIRKSLFSFFTSIADSKEPAAA